MIARLGACVALACAMVALAGGGAAGAQVCAVPPYPGDAAPREAVAQWMAYGAGLAGLPRELPVMGALVETGLQNLNQGDADSAGYFQMRTSIWNQGEYQGFPERPELQVKWFVDSATIIRRNRLATGAPDPAVAETDWGAWIADILRPSQAFRGRYQLRLGEARTLVGAACVPAAPGAPIEPSAPAPAPAPAPPPPPLVDTVAPVVKLTGRRRQRALARGAIVVAVACPAERCAASATATLRLPGARRALRLVSRARVIEGGGSGTLRLALGGQSRARVRKALRARPSLAARTRTVVVDAAGNRTVRRRTVRITG